MLIVKRMSILLIIIIIAFLAYQCGEKKDKYNSAQEGISQTESSETNESALKGDPVEGKTYFDQTCSACHGRDAKGLPKLGKDLTTSEFVAKKTYTELIDFVKHGRQPSDPLNSTGVAMPPKGGNPALTDQQLIDIISYLKQLHK